MLRHVRNPIKAVAGIYPDGHQLYHSEKYFPFLTFSDFYLSLIGAILHPISNTHEITSYPDFCFCYCLIYNPLFCANRDLDLDARQQTPASAGSYGTKGVPAASNEPPCRYQPCYWTDKTGNFWLFGGVMSPGLGNDLWKYDVTTNMWTWMSGPNVISAPNSAGVAGTKGVPSVNNYPSARGYGANCWTDNNGDLWLYGGYGGFNDLWRYHIATNEWTWINGNQATTPPSYGTKGVPAASNTPGDKQEVKSAWVDGSNHLLMFGGQDASGNVTSAIWEYDISTDRWTWITGTNTPTTGSYGTFRVEAPTNEPPSRWSYTRWRDASGNLYIFAGGGGAGYRNDVWRYRPSTNQWTWVNGSNVSGDPGKYPATRCQFLDGYYPQNRYENQTPFPVPPLLPAPAPKLSGPSAALPATAS